MDNKNNLYCVCCDYQANFQCEYNKHLTSQKHARKGGKKIHKCENCEYVAINVWNLKMHQVLKHYTAEQKKELKYYCSICDNVTFTKLFYNNHINSTAHNNNVILEDQKNGKNNKIQLYKRTKKNNISTIELMANIDNTEPKNNDIEDLKIYIKELISEMKKEIINEINKIKI